ncbi:MAG: hypothetical protein ACLUOS_06725 [Odoribacter splanchnicus]
MSGVAERIFAYAVIILLEMPALHGSEMPDVSPAFRIGGYEDGLRNLPDLCRKSLQSVIGYWTVIFIAFHRFIEKEDKILFLQGKTK